MQAEACFFIPPSLHWKLSGMVRHLRTAFQTVRHIDGGRIMSSCKEKTHTAYTQEQQKILRANPNAASQNGLVL